MVGKRELIDLTPENKPAFLPSFLLGILIGIVLFILPWLSQLL